MTTGRINQVSILFVCLNKCPQSVEAVDFDWAVLICSCLVDALCCVLRDAEFLSPAALRCVMQSFYPPPT